MTNPVIVAHKEYLERLVEVIKGISCCQRNNKHYNNPSQITCAIHYKKK